MGAIQFIYTYYILLQRGYNYMNRKDAVECDRCAADTALTAVVFKKQSEKSMSAVGLLIYPMYIHPCKYIYITKIL